MDGSAQKVYLYAYDLTQGMAKSLAPMLIGRQLEGVWHSAIIVFGKEYFFGDGICNMPPGTTPFGMPTKKLYLGDTEITEDLFVEFLTEIKDRFTPMTYNIKTHNCNHFTNECSNFLIGSDIPHDILKQAEELFNTAIGKMVEPMMIQQQDALKQGSNNMFGSGSQPDLTSAMGGMNLGGTSTSASDSDPKLISVTSITQLQDLISKYPGIVIDCWSPTCPPWRKFKPEFEKMSNIYGSDKVKFLTVNTQENPDIAMNFNIQSIPAFFIMKNGELINNFVGANKSKLETIVIQLKQELGDEIVSPFVGGVKSEATVIKIKPDLGFTQFKPYSNEPILYEILGKEKLTKMFNNLIVPKVKDLLASMIEDEAIKEHVEALNTLLNGDFKIKNIGETEILQVIKGATLCPEKDMFLLFDFARWVVGAPNLAKYITSKGWEDLDKALERVENLVGGDPTLIPNEIVNAQLASSMFLCNLFKSKDSYTEIFEERDNVNRLLIYAGKMMNCPKDKAVSAAASMVINLMIGFDQIEISPLENDKETEEEVKQVAIEQWFDKYEDGFKKYCESVSESYSSQENVEALYRIIMSECRVLHSNYKLIEQFAGDNEYVKARLRLTQRFPSGKLNDSVNDFQKILSSYVKR